jgi:iron complex outermembrane receptor protein
MMKRQLTLPSGKQVLRTRTGKTLLPLALASAVLGSGQMLAQEVLEQITVTAKKRTQDVQRVDISMSVVDGATVKDLRLRTLPEAAALMENVEIFEDYPGAGIPTWIIRGVGLQDFNSNNTPTAPVYMDGTYQVATVMGGAGMFDIGQLEVLKGPQGGLYGRNTSGGAVVLNTRRATPGEREAYLNLGYGRWQQATLEGALNIPLADALAVRFAARGENGADGWQHSIGSGRVHGEKERWDLRSWLQYKPGDNFTLEWKLQGGDDTSHIPLGRSIGLYAYGSTGALCSAVLAGRRDDHNCINFGGVNRLHRNQGEIPEVIAAQADDGSAVFSDTLNRQSNDYLGSVLDLAWQGTGVELRSITAWDDFSYGVALDLDGSEGEYGHRFSNSDIKVLSQEFRLLSTTDEPLQWLAGLTWSAEEFDERRDFLLRDNTLVPLGQGRLGYEQTTDAIAAYVDAGYQMSQHWSVNANLRYTKEDKEYRNGSFFIPGATPFYFTRNLQADYALGSRTSGGVALNWAPADETLAYLKFSRGFKSGGFYGGFPFNPVEIQPYLEETIDALELGWKQGLPEYALQVNAALFHYEYEDVQGFMQDINPVTGTGIDRLGNQGDARHSGAELQLQWSPLTRFDVELGLAWLDARFVSTGKTTANLLRQQVAITGQRPYAPRWSGNALVQYRQLLANGLELAWTMAWSYRTDFAGNQSTLAERAVNYLPGYGLLNAGLNLGKAGQPWKGGVWIRNALDKSYRTRVKSDGLNSYIEMFGEPRAFGISVEYQL